MPNYRTDEVVEGSLLEHPVVLAWSRLQARTVRPEAVIVLKESRRHPWKRKSAVYRLDGAGPDGRAVVAKRCTREAAAKERLIYEEILPAVPVSAPDYYGSVADVDSGFCWLFLAEAPAAQHASAIAEHRIAAARWLALLHTFTQALPQATLLSDRGPAHYLYRLRLSQSRLLQAVENRALGQHEKQILRSTLDDLAALHSNWSEFEQVVASIPATLVHADFQEKNLRIQTTSEGIAVFAFDWESSGWGPPVPDLQAIPRSELAAYWTSVREAWPGLEFGRLQELARIGAVFFLVSAIDWATCDRLDCDWVERPVRYLEAYHLLLRPLLHGVV